VAKGRMRSWIAAGNDLLNAHDIKEGMQYAGGIKNTQIAVAEIIPGAGMNNRQPSKSFFLYFSYFKVIWIKRIFQMSPQYVLCDMDEKL
jgi:hypothetical protein